MPEYRSNWNEATRVQMPALVHLTRIGYEYFGKITEDMAGTVYDPDTNILIDVFKTQFAKKVRRNAGLFFGQKELSKRKGNRAVAFSCLPF